MRSSILFLLAALLLGAEQDAQAQNKWNVSFGYVTTPNYYESRAVKKEVRELKAFLRKTEKFEYALYDRDLRKARRIKYDLLESMKDEIYQTKDKLYSEKKYHSRSKRRAVSRRSNSLSKRNRYNSYSNRYALKTIIKLERRLEKQAYILEEFEYARLSRSQKSEIAHKRLLKQFAQTLKSDVSQTRKQNGY